MNKKLLVLIIILASFLRLWKLDQVPVSMFSDELDVGYQAYSILKTGKDYSENVLPLHFESQAEYRTPLYIYASIPTVAILGITPYGVRLPAAIFGILGVYALYLLSNQIISRKFSGWDLDFGLLPALLLTISPWHIQYSRAAFEVTMMIAFLMFGLYFFFRYSKSGKCLWLSVLLLGLTPWIYSTAKLFIPFFTLSLVFIWRKKLSKIDRFQLIKAILVITLMVAPMIFVTLKGQAGNRFSYISVFTNPTLETDASYDRLIDTQVRQKFGGGVLSQISSRLIHNKYSIIAGNIVENILSSFSTEFLFTRGDTNLRHSIDGMGQFYKIEFISLILGLILFFAKFKDKKVKQFIGAWIILGVIPTALTREGGQHATRLIIILPPLILLISYGIYSLWKECPKKLAQIFLLLYAVTLGVNFYFYQHNYWYNNPWHSERSWHAGYKELVDGVKDLEGDYENIIITNAVEPPWIYFVSYYPYPPQLQPRNLEKEDVYGFGELERLDKYHFGQIGEIGVKNLARVLDSDTLYIAAEREIGENLIINPDKVYKGLTLVKLVAYPSGEPAFYFFDKDESVEVEPLELTK